MIYPSWEVVAYAIFLLGSFLMFRAMSRRRDSTPKLPPGPMALPIIGHLHHLGPILHLALHKLSVRYGGLCYLRLGSMKVVVVSTPEMAKEIFKTHDANFCNRPERNTAVDFLTSGVAKTLKPQAEIWVYIKKISLSELLGAQNGPRYRAIRTKELHHFLGKVASKSKAGEMVNISNELFKLTNNIISQALISKRVSDMEGVDPTQLIREMISLLGSFYIPDFIGFFKLYDVQGFKKKLAHTKKRFTDVVEVILRERELEREQLIRRDDKDFLDVMLDSTLDTSEVKLSRDHVKVIIMEYLASGTDTMAVAIEWAMGELINNPRVMNKAKEEIKRVVGNNKLVGEEDTPKLPYINAIIKESLRLHPPIPVPMRESKEEATVKGYTLPSRTVAIVNLNSIGRDPEYWKDPLEFKPERFMEGEEGESYNLLGNLRFEFLPFGSGRRYCSGMYFAMNVMPVALSAIIQCFDWQVPDNGKKKKGGKLLDLTERHGFTVAPLHEIVCKVNILLDPSKAI